MWEQISNMIENGQTYTEIVTYLAKTHKLISNIYDDEEKSHFDSYTHKMAIWDNIINVCNDVMEEMKIVRGSVYYYGVMDRCFEVFMVQADNGELINNVIIKTISSFIEFLEDKSIGDWRDNLIYKCDDNNDDMIDEIQSDFL